MGRKGQRFITHGGHRGTVYHDNGNTLFVKYDDGDKANIPASDVKEFYPNRHGGRRRPSTPPPTPTRRIDPAACPKCQTSSEMGYVDGVNCPNCEYNSQLGECLRFKTWLYFTSNLC